MSDESRRAPTWLAGLLLLLALPLALRVVPLDHGQPRNYVPDTHVVRAALGMAKDRNPVPPVGAYSTYPNLLPYLLLPVYGGDYALGRATGRFGGVGEFQMHVLEHPEEVHGLARWMVALFGVATGLAIFLAGRAAGLTSGAWVAAWLIATGTLHLHFSVQERPWGPLVFFLALCAWFAARYARDGRLRDLVLCGASAGLGFATHQAGLPFLAVAGLAWLFGSTGWTSAGALRTRLGHGVAAVLAFAALGFLVGHPYLFVHGATPVDQVSGSEGIGELEGTVTVGGQGMAFQFRAASFTRLSRALFGYDPALLVLGLAGLALALRRPGTRSATCFALLWGAVFLTNQNDHVRYLLPLAVLLALPAGCAGEWLWSRGAVARGLLVLVLAVPLVQSTRLAWVLSQPDTRALAEARLAELPESARVAIDRYGPIVDLDLASLERLAELRELGSRERHRRERLQVFGDAGVDAVAVEDLVRFDERHRGSELSGSAAGLGTTVDEVLDTLGVTHVLLVDRDPGDGLPPLLVDPEPSLPLERGPSAGEPAPKLPPLVGLGEPLWTIDPSPTGNAREARLPTELEFPLISLWRVERPGPRLELRPR